MYLRAISRASVTLFPSARGPKATLSITLIQVKSAPCWNTTPRSGPGAPISLPSSTALPVVGVSKPATMFSSVLLPQPEGPTMVTNSPAPIARSIGCSACTTSSPPPKRLDTPSTTSFAPARRDGVASATDSIPIGARLSLRHTILATKVESTNGAQLGGIVEAIVDGESGLLTDQDDASGLAEHLGRLLEDPELRRRIGQGDAGIVR